MSEILSELPNQCPVPSLCADHKQNLRKEVLLEEPLLRSMARQLGTLSEELENVTRISVCSVQNKDCPMNIIMAGRIESLMCSTN